MESKKINPLFSIWKSPRATTRFLLDNRPLTYFFGLAALFSIIYLVETALIIFTLEPALLKGVFTLLFAQLIFLCSILFIAITITILAASAVIYTTIAHDFDGTEPIGKTFGALVSSLTCSLPWGLCIWLFFFFHSFEKIGLLGQFLCAMGVLIFPIYTLVVLVNSIAEAQKVSGWKASFIFLIGTPAIIGLLFALYYARLGL